MITLPSGSQYYTAKEYNELRAECDEYLVTMQSMRNDANVIAERLRDEAVERDWCELYNNFVEEVNGSTSIFKLLNANREFEVKFLVSRKQEAVVKVTVKGISSDDAYQTADETWDYSSLANEVNEWDWELEDYDVEISKVSEQ